MTQQINQWLREHKSGYTLPRALYTERAAFDCDLKKVFHNSWIYAACEADVGRPGDYYCFSLGDNSIIITRDRNGALHGLHNSCCHRGSRVCRKERDNRARLVCPYHQWTYDLDGRLVYAPSMGRDFDLSRHRLRPMHLESIGGLIFVCLADEPPASIARARADLAPYLDIYNLRSLKLAWQEDIVEDSNWKLVMENNRECYHCHANHPQLMTPLYEFGFGYDESDMGAKERKEYQAYVEAGKRKEKEWRECQLPYKLIDFPDGLWYRTTRLPLAKGAVSETSDGKLGCRKLLAPFTEPETSALSLWTHPNSWHHFLCDHIVTFKVMPLNEGQTLLRTKWLVHQDAVEGEDYDLQHLINCWMETNKQDRTLAENNFLGVKSDGYRPGPYSPVTEGYVQNFTDWYTKQLRAHIEE